MPRGIIAGGGLGLRGWALVLGLVWPAGFCAGQAPLLSNVLLSETIHASPGGTETLAGMGAGGSVTTNFGGRITSVPVGVDGAWSQTKSFSAVSGYRGSVSVTATTLGPGAPFMMGAQTMGRVYLQNVSITGGLNVTSAGASVFSFTAMLGASGAHVRLVITSASAVGHRTEGSAVLTAGQTYTMPALRNGLYWLAIWVEPAPRSRTTGSFGVTVGVGPGV